MQQMQDAPCFPPITDLADASEEMLAEMSMFTNEVSETGPLDFQLDVFDHVSGDSRCTPSRRVSLVTWNAAQQARVLKSASVVEDIRAEGLIAIATTDVVVNAPILRWRPGRR